MRASTDAMNVLRVAFAFASSQPGLSRSASYGLGEESWNRPDLTREGESLGHGPPRPRPHRRDHDLAQSGERISKQPEKVSLRESFQRVLKYRFASGRPRIFCPR
jgi:hypothetical protein